MKKIQIKLTKKQVEKLESETKRMIVFGLLAQPIVSGGYMRVLILDTKECVKCDRFMKRFVPKELRVT